MARTLVSTSLLVVLALAAGCRQAPEKAPLVDRWLAGGNDPAQVQELIRELQANRDEVESQLIEAFRTGPADEQLEAIETSEERVWSRIQVQLAEPETYRLTEKDIAAMKAISLADQKRIARDRFAYNFKATALQGLKITKGQSAQALLREVASDPKSPFRTRASSP